MSDIYRNILKNSDGSITFHTYQDSQDILDQNTRECNDDVHGSNNTFGRKVATVPNALLEQWCREWGCSPYQLTRDPALKAKFFARLNSNEYSKLRTHNSRI